MTSMVKGDAILHPDGVVRVFLRWRRILIVKVATEGALGNIKSQP